MTAHTIEATRTGHYNGMDWEEEYVIAFRRTPDEEVPFAFVSARLAHGVLDHGAFTDLAQADIDDWARNWVEGGFHDEEMDAASIPESL